MAAPRSAHPSIEYIDAGRARMGTQKCPARPNPHQASRNRLAYFFAGMSLVKASSSSVRRAMRATSAR